MTGIKYEWNPLTGELLGMLALKKGAAVPVFSTAATTGLGVAEVARWLQAPAARGGAALAA